MNSPKTTLSTKTTTQNTELPLLPMETWTTILGSLFRDVVDYERTTREDRHHSRSVAKRARNVLTRCFCTIVRKLSAMRLMGPLMRNVIDMFFEQLCSGQMHGETGDIIHAMVRTNSVYTLMFRSDSALDYVCPSAPGLSCADLRMSATTRIVLRYISATLEKRELFRCSMEGAHESIVLDCANIGRHFVYVNKNLRDVHLITPRSIVIDDPEPSHGDAVRPVRMTVENCAEMTIEQQGRAEIAVIALTRPCKVKQNYPGSNVDVFTKVPRRQTVVVSRVTDPSVIETFADTDIILVSGIERTLNRGSTSIVVKHSVRRIDFLVEDADDVPEDMRMVDNVTFTETGSVHTVRVMPMTCGAPFTEGALQACLNKCEVVIVELPKEDDHITGRFTFGPQVKTIVVLSDYTGSDCRDYKMYDERLLERFTRVFGEETLQSIPRGITIGFERVSPTPSVLKLVKQAGCSYYTNNVRTADHIFVSSIGYAGNLDPSEAPDVVPPVLATTNFMPFA